MEDPGYTSNQHEGNQSAESSVCSSITLKAQCVIKEEPDGCSFFDENSYKKEQKDSLITKDNSEHSKYPSNQPVEILLCPDPQVKKESTINEESVCNQITQIVSNISTPSTSKNLFFKNDLKEEKNNGEELDLPLNSNNEFGSPPPPSKQKLHNTKRRAGILYKQLKNSKLRKVTSKYFSQPKNDNKKPWIPPRSPYALVQEDLFDNPWQLLVATIFLTKTTAKKALPQLHRFLARYPRPEDVLKANYEDIDEYFKPLGLTTTRSHIIMRFTVEYLEKDWTYPRELYGIGKYGDDSFRIFCINEWREVTPDDIPLTNYRNWLLENAERLGID